MIELITPSSTIGWIGWDFFAKSLEIKDKLIVSAVCNMIGFRMDGDPIKAYYVGDLTEDKQLQFMHQGAYETRAIEKNSMIFYSKTELYEMLCEQYEKHTHKTLNLKIFIK